MSTPKARKVRKGKWRSIKSAPKDGAFYLATTGTEIFVRNQPTPYHGGGVWHYMSRLDKSGYLYWGGAADGRHPTHWMPLPHPPAVAPSTANNNNNKGRK